MTAAPRIYVASLSDYNAGRLHGTWIDANQDTDDIKDAISAMLKDSKEPVAEEYAIHDYENFGPIKLREHESIDDVARIAAAIDEHGEAFKLAYANFSDLDAALEAVTEHYQGSFRSLEDWAEQFLSDTGAFQGVSDTLQMYFDYDRYARDAELGGDIWSDTDSEGNVHVFWNR